MNDSFKVDISIDKSGSVKGKIIELAFNEEYTNIIQIYKRIMYKKIDCYCDILPILTSITMPSK